MSSIWLNKLKKNVYLRKIRNIFLPFIRLFIGFFGLRPKRRYLLDYSYRQGLLNQCPSEGIILDIASGNNPFPNATILADRFLNANLHRSGNLVLDNRPFVVLDIEYLPFQDKSIDYIHCSHVLEHVENPEQACSEIIRVGKAGYIETPTFMKDALFSWAKEIRHKWHVVVINKHILFFEYSERQIDGVRSNYWTKTVLGKYRHPNQDIFFPNQDIFNAILEWKNRFDVTVYRLDTEIPIDNSGKQGEA